MSNFHSVNCYITKGINESIPIEFIAFMFNAINELRSEIELDCLQVFNMTINGKVQVIEHHQEVPPYKKTYNFLHENPISEKIFVIDDGDHITMLLADEY